MKLPLHKAHPTGPVPFLMLERAPTTFLHAFPLPRCVSAKRSYWLEVIPGDCLTCLDSGSAIKRPVFLSEKSHRHFDSIRAEAEGIAAAIALNSQQLLAHYALRAPVKALASRSGPESDKPAYRQRWRPHDVLRST
jgi:hypothetical protein